MPLNDYTAFLLQVILGILVSSVLLISVISLFIKPAKRTIRASLVDPNSGHIVDISLAETSIGRAKACDMVLSDISVSRFHAVLSRRKTGWMIFDTNSTSGVMLNGKKIEDKAFLKDGDKLRFGKVEFIFYTTAVTTRRKSVSLNAQQAEQRPKYSRAPKEKEKVRYRKADNNRPKYKRPSNRSE